MTKLPTGLGTRRTIWYGVGIMPLVGLLFVGTSLQESLPRSGQHAWNLGHVLLFFWLAHAWLGFRTGRGDPPRRAAGEALAGALVLGIIIEVIQGLTGRTMDLGDLILDSVGAGLAIGMMSAALSHRGRTAIRLVMMGAIIVLALPAVSAAIDEAAARRAFPVLADFETRFESARWETDGRSEVETGLVRHGRRAFRVRLPVGEYASASLQHFPGDWSAFETLAFEVYNPGPDTLQLHSRVHDEQHEATGRRHADRFNRVFDLAPGWTGIVIPLADVRQAPDARAMDLTRVRGFSVFVMDVRAVRELVLDYVRLRT